MVLLVLALRLPFLNQAIQGDDYYYLSGAMHAQIDPLHPTHGQYVFAGQLVDMRGHPHPPLDMWILGALIAAVGDIREVPFHAAYIVFTLIAALGMWSLARRFSPRPFAATLLFLAVPPLVINGNSFEADLPFLAFWMAAAALFIRAADRRSVPLLLAAALAMVPAALGAYQSVVLIPILACYLLLHDRRWAPGWIVLATPAVALGCWQIFERITGGALPAGVLAGYFETYGFQAAANKLQNAAALTTHAGWIVFPLLVWAAFWKGPVWTRVAALAGAAAGAVWIDHNPLFWAIFGTGLLAVLWCLAALRDRGDRDRLFLAAWVVIFFGAALALFFAGSARYLLPMAAPLCLLVSRQLAGRPAWLAVGIVAQLALALALSTVNYQHWDGYRRFVAELGDEFDQRRVWVNGEWGLRYYAESRGGLPLELSQPVQPGEMVLTSEISYPSEFTTGGGVLTTLLASEIRPWLPLRLFGLGARSAYSTVTQGYRAFDVVFGPVDRVTAQVVIEREPVLSYLPMNAPEAESQIASGIYQLEDGAWRWMSERGVLLLKAPAEPLPVEAVIYIPDQSPAREVTLVVDGATVARERVPGPGSYTVRSEEPVTVAGDSATLEIQADRTFSPPGDTRRLGLVLSAAGFRSE